MISFKMSIASAEQGQVNFKKHKAWKKNPPKRAHPVIIRAYIYQCKDIPAADSNGTSDPFIKVWDMSKGKTKKTQVIEDNNNPLFYECIEMEYEVREIEDLESYPPFIFDLFDRDTGLFDGGNDFLARAIIEPEDCSIVKQSEFDPCKAHDNPNCSLCLAIRTQAEIPGTPRWHPLRYSENDPESG